MQISVIIPTYNRREIVARAVRSAINQSLPALEVIVVDDGSKDDTCARMDSDFGNSISLLHLPRNNGVSAARNQGSRAASGEYLVFLDSDDELLPDALERLIGLTAGSSDVGLARTAMTVQDPISGRESMRHAAGFVIRQCYPRGACIPGSYMVARRLFLSAGGFDEKLRFSENTELLLRLWKLWRKDGWRVVAQDVSTVLHRRDIASHGARHRGGPAAAAKHMLDLHEDVLRYDREAYRNLLAIIANDYRSSGHRRAALRYFFRAWCKTPMHLISALRVLRCAWPWADARPRVG